MLTLKLALAGDTMLGRGVARALESPSFGSLFADQILEVVREVDLFILNLECCISDRGERWSDPTKAFFFRAPPAAAEVLAVLGVDCVTLANNHALDYGPVALVDTLDHLVRAGISAVGAGRDQVEARRPVILEKDGFRLRVIGITDHPPEYAAAPGVPGVAYDSLRRSIPDWIRHQIAGSVEPVLVTPHWGPNMTEAPVSHVRRAARRLADAGATLVAGHSAHTFHGVSGRVLYDLGDFIDDYAVDPRLRNDLGLLFLVDLAPSGPKRIEAVPIALDFCHTRLAKGDEVTWVQDRFTRACDDLGTDVTMVGGRLIVESLERA